MSPGSDAHLPFDDPSVRLATYGTLAPGRVNYPQVAGLDGRWTKGIVRGRLVEVGWGAALGYPGVVLDPTADTVEVHLLHSPDLPRHWPRLDAFEGSGYRRVAVWVETGDTRQRAFIYEIIV